MSCNSFHIQGTSPAAEHLFEQGDVLNLQSNLMAPFGRDSAGGIRDDI